MQNLKTTLKTTMTGLVCLTALLFMAGCGPDQGGTGNVPEVMPAEQPAVADTGGADNVSAAMPAELQAIVDKATQTVSLYAKQLDGEWGDLHAALIESEKGESFERFGELLTTLRGFAAETDANDVYAMVPSGNYADSPYIITVDGSNAPDPYGKEYKWEKAYSAAWEGTVSASDLAWKDDDGNLMLSAFAPVYDSQGNVTAIFGADYKAPEAADHPDWIEK